LETGGDLASVALLEGMEVAAERVFRHRMSLSRELMPAIEALLVEARVAWAEVGGIAVGLGPGSYTGLRIGVVTAKALSWASGRPVLGISSLAALVAPHLAPPEALLCAVLEARAGEFYTALYQRRDGELQLRAEATVLRAEELAQRLRAYPGPVLAAGHTARFARALRARDEEIDTAGSSILAPQPWPLAFTDFDEEPQARWVGRLAAARLRAGEHDDPIALAPLYVRPPAPTIQREAS
jgi:tRNA threonylcarbamoyladenosine biosynthesis protein TsaB